MDQRKKAEKFADMIFRPEGARRPDRRQVLEFLTGQADRLLYAESIIRWNAPSAVRCFPMVLHRTGIL